MLFFFQQQSIAEKVYFTLTSQFMKKGVPFLFFVFISQSIVGQTIKTVQQQEQAWLGYTNQTRLSTKWGIWGEVHLRRTDFLARWNQTLYRAGLTYYVADNVRLTAGYAYIGAYLAPSGIVRPEHRPWQQVWWTSRSGRLNLTQWVRSEQRFNHRVMGDQLANGYGFNWRLRYNIMLQIPLKGEAMQPGVPNFVVQNETFVNLGKQITYNYFDQNRFFVGLSYPFSKSFTAQAGYMNLFQQQATGNVFANNHVARLFLFHNLDLRKQP
jgi:hypothetical protein